MEKIISSTVSGSSLGGALLIGGCCIGGGMFALPIIAGMSGFLPSLLFFVIAWAFMVTTAFFIQHVMNDHPECTNFLSLTRKVLGPIGEGVVFLSFISLFFSLVIAYLVKGGALLQDGLARIAPIPSYSGMLLLAVASCLLVIKGIRLIDSFNKIFMCGLVITFLYLTFSGSESRNFSFISQMNWNYSIPTFSFLVISFGFHNLLPSLNNYLGRDERKVKKAIIFGALFPFGIYLIWLLHFLSLVPYEGAISIVNSYQTGKIASEVLGEILQSPSFVFILQGFAFFAIITSLLAQALSLQDFLQDGIRKISQTKRSGVAFLIFIPAFAIAMRNPNVFFQLLEIGGGVIAIILFGIIPSLMILKTPVKPKSWTYISLLILLLSSLIAGGEIWDWLS